MVPIKRKVPKSFRTEPLGQLWQTRRLDPWFQQSAQLEAVHRKELGHPARISGKKKMQLIYHVHFTIFDDLRMVSVQIKSMSNFKRSKIIRTVGKLLSWRFHTLERIIPETLGIGIGVSSSSPKSKDEGKFMNAWPKMTYPQAYSWWWLTSSRRAPRLRKPDRPNSLTWLFWQTCSYVGGYAYRA